MSIYIDFLPTWLYIKQHNVTGLKYFGKTTRKDPVRYRGSGTRWVNHLRKHGNDITTIWCQLFTNKQELIEYALKFSTTNKIVESDDWANLIPENGLGSVVGQKGHAQSEETRQKISEAGKRHGPHTEEDKKKMSDALKGKIFTKEHKQNLSAALKGKPGIVFTDEIRKKISNNRKGLGCGPRRPRTIEEKKKISDANRGKIRTEKHRQNMSAALKGRTISPETRKKLSLAAINSWNKRKIN